MNFLHMILCTSLFHDLLFDLMFWFLNVILIRIIIMNVLYRVIVHQVGHLPRVVSLSHKSHPNECLFKCIKYFILYK
jgi:hypothetical protein